MGEVGLEYMVMLQLHCTTCFLYFSFRHCAFKTSIQETGWDVVSFLRALYNLFKDSPARRALFSSLTDSNIFPKKFCAVRWLKNVDVAQRAIELIPKLKIFVDEVEKNKSLHSNSYEIVKRAISDQLLSAKLEFFSSLASDIEPFLEKFQSDEPMVPFLFEELSALLMTQISRIIKPGALEEIKSLKDLKILEKNYLSASEISIGIAAKSAINKANKTSGKMKALLILQFRESCKKALIKFIHKMLDKSPLNLRLTKAASCFDPKVAANPKIAQKRMELLLTILLENNWLSSSNVDKIMRDYNVVITQAGVASAMKNYDRKERIDHFWMKHIDKMSNLSRVIKIICVMSHGNANVERGFSVNAECVVENMRDELLVARRIVYDTILSIGGIYNLEVKKTLIHAARNSYSRFVEATKQKKSQQEEMKLTMQNKRKAEMDLKELQRKKAKILEDAQRQANMLNEEMKMLAQKM